MTGEYDLDPGTWLDSAREAFAAADYPKSLANYDRFFDHALDDDQHAYYGVRLSYCLLEWVNSGQVYEPAFVALQEKKAASLALFSETGDPESFHDYAVICKRLGIVDEAVDRFLKLDEQDNTSAKTVVRFMWKYLVDEEQWEICSKHTPNALEAYSLYLGKFDGATKVGKEDSAIGDDDYFQLVRSWYVRDVSSLLSVLLKTDRVEEVELVTKKVNKHMTERGHEDMIALISTGYQ